MTSIGGVVWQQTNQEKDQGKVFKKFIKLSKQVLCKRLFICFFIILWAAIIVSNFNVHGFPFERKQKYNKSEIEELKCGEIILNLNSVRIKEKMYQ